MMPGFPSYCADSLMMKTSPNACCRSSCIRRRDFSHARLDNRPNQVRFLYASSSSYRFLQTPAFATDALASRILFPMNRVRSLTSSDGVCQLRWANEKATLRRIAKWPLFGGSRTPVELFVAGIQCWSAPAIFILRELITATDAL